MIGLACFSHRATTILAGNTRSAISIGGTIQRHVGSLDELWPNRIRLRRAWCAVILSARLDSLVDLEGAIHWPEGGERLRPQQLLNAMREQTPGQMGPDVPYSHLDPLRDSGLTAKVVRSKYSLTDTAKRLRNCAASYHDKIFARRCVFVVLENMNGKPIALGKADLPRGDAAPRWGEIKEASNRRPSADTRAAFAGFLPSIARWWKDRLPSLPGSRSSV